MQARSKAGRGARPGEDLIERSQPNSTCIKHATSLESYSSGLCFQRYELINASILSACEGPGELENGPFCGHLKTLLGWDGNCMGIWSP